MWAWMNLEVIKVTQTHHICWLPSVTHIDQCLQILWVSFVGFLLNANTGQHVWEESRDD